MASTTPVTILKEVVSSLTQALRQGVGHIWALSTDEIILHQFGAICKDEIFRVIFEDVVSINFFPDEAQSRFHSLSLASSGSCGHH